MTKKRTKKYNPHKAKDIISKFEWIGSIYYQFYDKLYTNVMQNKCTVQTLVEDIAQLHRLTFLPCDYDLSEVRQLIEDLFDQYLTGHDVESAESIADQPVDIKDTELLLAFLDMAKQQISSYTRRSKFSADNNVMLSDHNAYCTLKQIVIRNFIDFEAVADAQYVIRKKLKELEIRRAHKQNKTVLVNDTGDIIIGE